MKEFDVIGRSLPNVDAFNKVRGGYDYPIEKRIPGMLYGKILRSRVPHARIRAIDTTKAQRHAGVKAIITWRDLPKVYYHPKIGVDPNASSAVRDCLVLEDVVRYLGDEVAAVAATSEDAAAEAVEMIQVEYDDLPYIHDMEQALKDGSTLVHPDRGKVAYRASRGWGDVKKGLEDSDLVFEGNYETQRVSQFPLEPHVCLCDINRDGNLTVYSSTQMIHGLKERLGTVLQYPMSKIRVVRPRYIGGAFGAKLDMNPIEPLTVMLALKSGRPVRVRLTREEEMLTTAFMPTVQKITTGVRKNGTLLANVCHLMADCGAHSSHAPSIVMVAASAFLASYKSPNSSFETEAIYTNNPPAGAYRGYGGPQGLFGMEQQMDVIAEELKIDPVDLRIMNSWRVGDPNPRFNGELRINSYAFEKCLRRGAEAFGWKNHSGKGTHPPEGLARGSGLACIPLGGSGVTGKKGGSIEMSGAIMKLNVDGSIDLIMATIDQGGGQNTTLAQIAAEAVGCKYTDIHISETDTEGSPIDAPTHATRVTYVVGSVIEKAANELRTRILESASAFMGVSKEELLVRESVVSSSGNPKKRMSFEEIARGTTYGAPGNQLMGQSTEISHSNPTPSGAHFAEVEVDTETGKVRVTRYLAIHDVGRAINPLGVEGQVTGGIAQGIGYALSENLHFDSEGNPHGTDLADYKMQGPLDVPEVQVIIIEEPDPTGPFGAKGVSEPAIIPVAAAIANAVYDAIGVRITKLPITPASVIDALSKKRNGERIKPAVTLLTR